MLLLAFLGRCIVFSWWLNSNICSWCICLVYIWRSKTRVRFSVSRLIYFFIFVFFFSILVSCSFLRNQLFVQVVVTNIWVILAALGETKPKLWKQTTNPLQKPLSKPSLLYGVFITIKPHTAQAATRPSQEMCQKWLVQISIFSDEQVIFFSKSLYHFFPFFPLIIEVVS